MSETIGVALFCIACLIMFVASFRYLMGDGNDPPPTWQPGRPMAPCCRERTEEDQA